MPASDQGVIPEYTAADLEQVKKITQKYDMWERNKDAFYILNNENQTRFINELLKSMEPYKLIFKIEYEKLESFVTPKIQG